MVKYPRLLGKAMAQVTVVTIAAVALIAIVILGFQTFGFLFLIMLIFLGLLSGGVAGQYHDLASEENSRVS